MFTMTEMRTHGFLPVALQSAIVRRRPATLGGRTCRRGARAERGSPRGAWRRSGFTDGWHGWWPLNGGVAAPDAHVTAVSRSQDKLDIFAIDTDKS